MSGVSESACFMAYICAIMKSFYRSSIPIMTLFFSKFEDNIHSESGRHCEATFKAYNLSSPSFSAGAKNQSSLFNDLISDDVF